MVRRRAWTAVVAGGAALLVPRGQDDSDNPSVRAQERMAVLPRWFGDERLAAVRAARAVSCVLSIVVENAVMRNSENRAAMFQRQGQRTYRVLEKNGGVYTKTGQMLSQMDHLLPVEYCRELRPLFNECKSRDWHDVKRLLESELLTDEAPFCSLNDIFETVETQPVASASLASVYRAKLTASVLARTCTDAHEAVGTSLYVAIKVQHPELAFHAPMDILVVKYLLRIGGQLFETVSKLSWLAEELEQNLPKELDFSVEAQNLQRCAQNIASSHSAIVRRNTMTPQAFPELSSKRVLTMSFESGVLMSDRAAIEKLGLAPADVSRVLAEFFSDQIFERGFVHCDPHSANVLVRVRDETKHSKEPMLVILDHGLYRQLSDEMRLDYARLWRAILMRDEVEIYRLMRKFHIEDEESAQLFFSMLTFRSWSEVEQHKRVGFPAGLMSADRQQTDSERVKQFAAQNADRINDLLGRVPRDVLFLLKMHDCLRAVDRQLGAPYCSLLTAARFSLGALARNEAEMDTSPALSWSFLDARAWSAHVFTRVRYATYECVLALIQLITRVIG
ncbi:putative ABC1 protein [Porphyridium purpureum]|uniref:Putative ABC1 protein n=1 Tax=Porphyridium purpureum TaxID=35688 RepID=A0A5J4YXK5_PORPP|nr:putative ABC1 protein [Porphyridium purpureum]|eukprot:POR1889..scf209_3